MEAAAERPHRARWTTGLYGGVGAGVVLILFILIVRGALMHDTTLPGWFAFVASGLVGSGPASKVAVAFGAGLYFLTAAISGIIYAFFARIVPALIRSPGSLIFGLLYGLCVWLVLANVVVPALGMTDTTPLWEALVGSMVFFGWPMAELIAVLAHRGL